MARKYFGAGHGGIVFQERLLLDRAVGFAFQEPNVIDEVFVLRGRLILSDDLPSTQKKFSGINVYQEA